MFATRDLTPSDREYLERVRRSLRIHGADRQAQDHAAYYLTTLMERGLPVLFNRQHLAHITGVESSVIASMAAYQAPHYSTFRIPKRGGGSRQIAAPGTALKHIQRWISRSMLNALTPHEACRGFAPGRSIVSNAEPHVGAKLILKLDLRDFFPSVDGRAVFRVFRRIGYSREVSSLLTSLATLGDRLPQGAPTSPQLANFAAYDLDTRLARLAKRRDLVYTRYADDLTFSGQDVADRRVKRRIERVVREHGFRPNERKARYLHPHHRQVVTGIVVNDKLNWPRSRRKWLRQEAYYLERFGVDEHVRRRGWSRALYKEFIYGHAYALNMVRPDEARARLEQLDNVEWSY